MDYRPERALRIVFGSISFFMNRNFPGFAQSFALLDPISIFNALFLISRRERMIQSSVAICHSNVSCPGTVFTDIFTRFWRTQLSLGNLIIIYNIITVPARGLQDFQFSRAGRLSRPSRFPSPFVMLRVSSRDFRTKVDIKCEKSDHIGYLLATGHDIPWFRSIEIL
jgi:hypothetical protein